MKKILYLATSALLFSACGGKQTSVIDIISEGNIETIRAKKTELSEKQRVLETELQKLDSAISSMSGEEKLPLVTTVVAKVGKFEHFLELQGDVKTKQNVLIYPEMSGTLQRVYVKEGQRVTKGQVLAVIDDGGRSSQLSQLKSQAALAKTTFERRKRLWEQKIGSEIEYLSAQTNYQAAEDAVKQAESQLGKSSIRAPFSGIIDDVIKDQGTVVSPGPGSEVFRIVNLSDMYIEVDVPETYLGGITKGKEAKVYFPVLGDSILTKVRQTGNFINPSNRAFSAEIPVPNKKGNIKPNLSAKVSINDYTNENAIVIPQGIISENAEGEQYVYVAQPTDGENEALLKKSIIQTGKTQGSHIEVLSGISDGDHIIEEGARSVKDGQKVKILNDQTDEQ
ncbi:MULTISPECIES: efflux RND transporter periplasmic adaptor subunit [Zobellia]|uniref:Membrane fusion protein n=1 Tax=Zobellia galactanivorans (strain DSM 12802 / CCUG 47099 / CIP 106680 / NCIMB 13871 / Dsij) TaxID=63186 RepID=G0L576_ZOBGA|nr:MULTISPECIES: efflux RND transporter periplasmic adaptor subunit [Zobellia]MBU3026504.1 efflux RND transporter periplasmic adaptor subunit [Zobellia galactanivorans]OWW26989.1 efflux transporter periplasmic adaptor subunit [Zobellia sp. OII3]CAZ95998.1 Membrane fusion protein [Zobellia galactanivorans]